MKKNNYYLKFSISVLLAIVVGNTKVLAQLNIPASYALIKRVIPQRSSSFVVEPLAASDKLY